MKSRSINSTVEMEPIRNFKGLIDRFYNMPRRKRVVVVCPHDEPTEEVVERCLTDNLVDVYLVTDGVESPKVEMWKERFPEHVTIINHDNPDDAAREAVALINAGKADVIMKGTINTDNLLRAVLDKECGLLPAGRVMSHVGVAEIPGYNRLLIFSDAAVIPYPTLEQFDAMIDHNTAMARRMGIETPKVALVHFTEKVNKKFQCTLDYVQLKERAAAGKYGDIKIGGPMDIKTALDPHSGEIKGIKSDVSGDADVLTLPDLECANSFYKTLVLFGGATIAAMLIGTTAPVVTPSRADSADSKFYSLALACVAGV